MKKAFGLILAAFVTLTLFAAPADAVTTGRRRQNHGTVCRILYAPNGNAISFPCVTVATHDFLRARVEAKAWTIDSDPGVKIRVDWIHLYRNGDLYRWTDGTGWQYAEITHSTSWGTCLNNDKFRAVVRIQAKYDGKAAGPWLKFDSGIWAEGGSYC